MSAGPRCLLEVLALDAIIREAEAHMELVGHEASGTFRDIHEYLFDDLDFRWMFDPAADGVDELPYLGMEPLTRSPVGLGYYGERVHPM